ncbi:MAG: phytanoyl-CoA dioxygenase family protein [Planctomyces sp.]|nr:phytanoyl-CoA dioxygenase family protein [Planctomyces sp.]
MAITAQTIDTGRTAKISSEQLKAYHDDGFVILRSLFSPAEMDLIQQECDRLLAEYSQFIDPLNLRCRFMPHHKSGEPLFEVFDPVNDLSELLHQVCFDVRITSALEAIYQEPAELFKEKLIYKMPGANGYRLHQDIPQSWPGWPCSFLTVLLAIDGCSRSNGCTEVYRGYHGGFLLADPSEYMLSDDCVCQSRREFLELGSGDVAIFHGLTPHGSAANQSAGTRRAFYISYNARSDGGDQRHSHYDAFQAMLKDRLIPESTGVPYFR